MYKIKLLLVLMYLSIVPIYSQCAMCRVVAESSKDAGGTIADGLNIGILYLMAFPYILLLFGFIVFYVRGKKYN